MPSLSIARKRRRFAIHPAQGLAWAIWSIGGERLLIVLVWGLVGWSAAYWVLSAIQGRGPVAGGELVATEAPVSDVQAVARALGTLAPASASSGVTVARYKLLGVAAGAQGVALIAVDDQPGRPYRLHAMLPDDAQVVALGQDMATLRLRDGQVLNLRVPPPSEAAFAPVVSVPPAPAMAISEAQPVLETQSAIESQAVVDRQGGPGLRADRSRDGVKSGAELSLERQD